MQQELTYEIAGSADLQALVDCVQRNFPEREPMAVALGLSAAQYLAYTRLVCAKAVRDGLTFVVRSGADDAVVAFCINEDYQSAPAYAASDLDGAMLPLLTLLEVLSGSYLRPNLAAQGEVFHLYMLAVDEEYAGLGLAAALMRKSLFLAKERGFDRAIAEATGPGSQSLCRKLGFVERAAVGYGDFEYEGKRIFKSIESASHCRLLEGSLKRLSEFTDTPKAKDTNLEPSPWSSVFSD